MHFKDASLQFVSALEKVTSCDRLMMTLIIYAIHLFLPQASSAVNLA